MQAVPRSARGGGGGGGGGVATPGAPGAHGTALCGVSMYAEQPEEELTLEDFEIYAFERLKGAARARRRRPRRAPRLTLLPLRGRPPARPPSRLAASAARH